MPNADIVAHPHRCLDCGRIFVTLETYNDGPVAEAILGVMGMPT